MTKITKSFREPEARKNSVKIDLRDAMMVENMFLEKFKERLNETKIRG